MSCRGALAVFALVFLLSGCSNPIGSLIGGGGPNVAANTQAGKTNSQTVGQTRMTEQRVDTAREVTQTADENKVRSESVQNQTNHFGLPWWAWLVIGIFIPSHREIAAVIRGDFKRSQKKFRGP